MANEYMILQDFKDRLHITDEKNDAIYESILNGISRFIDEITWRRFYSVTEVRHFTPEFSDQVFIDDCTAITEVKTDPDGDRSYSITWAITDYDLLPENANLDGKPWTEIQVAPGGDYSFPKIARALQINGDFGYVANGIDPPSQIVEATFLGANRVVERISTPLGVSASAAVGELRVVTKSLKSDPDFLDLVMHFSKGL